MNVHKSTYTYTNILILIPILLLMLILILGWCPKVIGKVQANTQLSSSTTSHLWLAISVLQIDSPYKLIAV